jgi:hypothetical protein
MTYRKKIFIICILLIAASSVSAIAQPPEVPRLTIRSLDEASYVELAKQWKQYIEENGESGNALINLARAYDYSGEMEAANEAAARAYEIDPESPKVLAYYAMFLASWVGDVEGSIELLERCREIAPDYGYGLTNLATSYMRLGQLEKADGVFKTIFKERTIAQPLQDYAYNMLVGLPEGAVLLTTGDDATFSPLALQAGMGLRRDVAVLNISLLTLEKYCDAYFKRYPSIKPSDKIKHDPAKPPHQTVIKRLLAEQPAPIYFTASTDFDFVGSKPETFIEGINLRAVKKEMSGEESARLLLETYRMDSATDWNFPWALVPQVTDFMKNYVAAMVRLSTYDVPDETKRKLLEKALTICEFHEFDRLSMYIKKSLKEL